VRGDGRPVVVAVVPAKDAEGSVGDTVTALLAVPGVSRVLVVDDGSTDGTAAAASAAGAEVLVLPRNRGKGGAVAAGVDASPDAEVHLLIDADVAGTAGAAEALLGPVLAGDADVTIGVLPAAGRKGGFGLVRDMAGAGIRRATGRSVRAPLSGQRAVRSSLLRSLDLAPRFGLEVGMTIDAVRAGARVVEVDLATMDHRHRGRRIEGFAHRGRQGVDVVRALWPRLTSASARVALVLVVTVVVAAGAVWSGAAARPSSVPPTGGADRVLIVGVPRLGIDDLSPDVTPNLLALAADGALANASVRTLSSRPTSVEAYATLGAGTRVEAPTQAENARMADDPLEGGTAREALERRTGEPAPGDVVVVGAPAAITGSGDDISSRPGALGDALHEAGLRTAVVGASDHLDPSGNVVVRRPAAVAVMDGAGAVDAGTVDGSALLVGDPAAPFGLRADEGAVLAAVGEALADADVVVVDPGDTDRAAVLEPETLPEQGAEARAEALRWTDALVGDLAGTVPDGTLLLVVGLTPPTTTWELTPVVAWGAGVRPGYLHSTSTNRLGLVALTDLAPTVLDALGAPVPSGMIGAPLRYHPGTVDLDGLRRQNDVAGGREEAYFPMALTFIVVQAVAYLLAAVILSQGVPPTGLRRGLRLLVLAFAAWPLSTFVLRAIPGVNEMGTGSHAVLIAIAVAVALVASRARRHPLSPLAWICGATVALLVVDVATGARLQMSSILGYSPHTAARYTGFGNTAFAVLGATAVLAAAMHVAHAPRRREALVTAAGLLAVVLVADGAPMLGNDVGGILTLVPVFALTWYVISGRRLSWKAVGVALAVTVAALAVATAVDLLRPAAERTHLGRFVTDVGDDEGTFLTTVTRKWETNVRVFGQTIWTWMVPIAAGFMIYVLVVARGWRRLLPPRSALRAGVVGTLAAGVVGWLVNDSGVVVTALMFVYVGPYLTLLALARERDEPVWLAPAPAVEGAPAAPVPSRV
jgi:glycosyltransferase involved in cell wall biosynthesis